MSVNQAVLNANAGRWAVARVLTAKQPLFNSVAKRLVAAKSKYQWISAKTGVPWFVIAVIHEREASQRWDANIAQGDPWNHISTHVPKGRGPFASWDEAANDALTNCSPYAAKWKDWSPGGTMTLLEMYNGLGYSNKGKPSPYIWAGTDQYSRGKYVADGVYDPNVVDSQLGCAGMILAMAALDPSITLRKNTMAMNPPPPDVAPIDNPAKPPMSKQDKAAIGGGFAFLGSTIYQWGWIAAGIAAAIGIAALIYFKFIRK